MTICVHIAFLRNSLCYSLLTLPV